MTEIPYVMVFSYPPTPQSGQSRRGARFKISIFCKPKKVGALSNFEMQRNYMMGAVLAHFKNCCAGVKRHVALPPDMSGGGGSRRLRIARAPARAAPRDKGQR